MRAAGGRSEKVGTGRVCRNELPVLSSELAANTLEQVIDLLGTGGLGPLARGPVVTRAAGAGAVHRQEIGDLEFLLDDGVGRFRTKEQIVVEAQIARLRT